MNDKQKNYFLRITRLWFPWAHILNEKDNELDVECLIINADDTFWYPGEYALRAFVDYAKRAFIYHGIPATISKFNYEDRPAGITFTVKDIWDNSEIDSLNMRCIVKQAVQNKLPVDDLHEVQLDEAFEYLIKTSEDGVGIKSSEHGVNFTVEAVDYCGCDGDPEDPDWSFYMVPCLWYYSGSVGDFSFEGLASTQNVGIGKAIRAIHRIAKKHQLQIAEALEENTVKWRSYGFCH